MALKLHVVIAKPLRTSLQSGVVQSNLWPSEQMYSKLAAFVEWSMQPYTLPGTIFQLRDVVKHKFKLLQGIRARDYAFMFAPGAPQRYPTINRFRDQYHDFYTRAYADPPVPPPQRLKPETYRLLQAETRCRRTKNAGPPIQRQLALKDAIRSLMLAIDDRSKPEVVASPGEATDVNMVAASMKAGPPKSPPKAKAEAKAGAKTEPKPLVRKAIAKK